MSAVCLACSGSGEQLDMIVLGHPDLSLDRNRTVILWQGKPLRVSPRQYRILEALALRRGTRMSSRELYEAVWGNPFDISGDENLRVSMSQLRRRLKSVDAPNIIDNAFGLGYCIA